MYGAKLLNTTGFLCGMPNTARYNNNLDVRKSAPWTQIVVHNEVLCID